MILAALARYYEALAAAGKIPAPGWAPRKISYALDLSETGKIKHITSVKEESQRGGKPVFRPAVMLLPAVPKRSSGVKPAFLCDNASYIFAVGDRSSVQQPERDSRAAACFDAAKKLHEEILGDVSHPAAKALLAYFQTWETGEINSSPLFTDLDDDFFSAANFVFRFGGRYLQEIPELGEAWQRYRNRSDGEKGICLITGEETTLARLHPNIKGVRGAQSAGASLVSFNAPAFCSYGKEQGLNAPVGERAAFAYTSALNALLADEEHQHYIGDTAVLCWAEGGDPAYTDIFSATCFGDEAKYSEKEYREMVGDISRGHPVLLEGERIDPDRPFYILGVAPNAARLSVRFFHTNSFGAVLRNLTEHQKRLEITHSSKDSSAYIPLWRLLRETVNENARKKAISPILSGEMLRSVLSDSPYPATLLNGVTLRIRADRRINHDRAAIIKAYYLKNPHKDIPAKEVLTVSLNPDSKSVPYNLGRLFAVLEAVQKQANPQINATIRDRYFNSASATPANTFPSLISLAQKHLKKIERDTPTFYGSYKKTMLQICDLLGETFPYRLNLPEQGAFQLGYYHQTAEIYRPKNKEEKNND